MPEAQIGASEFKAKCLKILDDVAANRESLTITKHGQPVARIVPVEPATVKPLMGLFAGRLEILGDIVSPLPDEWDALK